MDASRPDPLLAAGSVTCDTCRYQSFPSDATWLGDDLILATYPTGCTHIRTFTWLVKDGHHVPRPPRCDATTKAGTWCRARPLPQQPYCYVHRAYVAEKREAR